MKYNIGNLHLNIEHFILFIKYSFHQSEMGGILKCLFLSALLFRKFPVSSSSSQDNDRILELGNLINLNKYKGNVNQTPREKS